MCVLSHVRKGRCSVWVFGETYRVGDEREKCGILMSGFQYIVEGTQTVCDDGFLVRDMYRRYMRVTGLIPGWNRDYSMMRKNYECQSSVTYAWLV